MRSVVTVGAAVLAATIAVKAQPSKTLTGETSTITATVEAIERSTREVTLKNEDGTYEVLKVPADAPRFDTLKVGDKVKARYYETITIRLKPEGEPAIDTSGKAVTRPDGTTATTLANQRAITATITQLDPTLPSITFKGPNGWTYSSKVQDKKAIEKVKVGDRVDITWTAATLVSFESM